MRANGVSVLQMLRPVFIAGVLLMVANFLFIDQVLPRTNLRLLNLQNDIGQKKPTFSLREQVMNNLPGSQYFLQAGRIEPGTDRMREVVIYDMSPPDARRVIYADSGYMFFEGGQKNLGLLLYDGRVDEYKTAEPATVQVTRFQRNTILVRDIENAFRQSFGSVQKGDREMTTCEMVDRVASARQMAERAAARRRALGASDVLTLLQLFSQPVSADSSAAIPPHCGGWRRFERWMGRLLLPKSAVAQGVPAPMRPPVIVPPQGPPVVVPAQRPPAVVPPGRVDSAAVRPTFTGTPLSTLGDLSSARQDEEFAVREVAQYSVEIHKKFSLSVACLSFVLIGIALALRFPRGGIGLVIGGSLVIFAIFYVSLTAGETLADDGIISAALAMWLPNGIVLVAGVLGLIRVNREFGSTRGGDLADLGELFLGWIRRKRG